MQIARTSFIEPVPDIKLGCSDWERKEILFNLIIVIHGNLGKLAPKFFQREQSNMAITTVTPVILFFKAVRASVTTFARVGVKPPFHFNIAAATISAVQRIQIFLFHNNFVVLVVLNPYRASTLYGMNFAD